MFDRLTIQHLAGRLPPPTKEPTLSGWSWLATEVVRVRRQEEVLKINSWQSPLTVCLKLAWRREEIETSLTQSGSIRAQDVTYPVIPFIQNIQNRQISRDRWVVVKGWGWGWQEDGKELLIVRAVLWGWWKCSGTREWGTTICMYWLSLTVGFMFGRFYHNFFF